MSRRSDLRKLRIQVEEAEKQALLRRLEVAKNSEPPKNSFESFQEGASGCVSAIITGIVLLFLFAIAIQYAASGGLIPGAGSP
jgi:hypothetical protein